MNLKNIYLAIVGILITLTSCSSEGRDGEPLVHIAVDLGIEYHNCRLLDEKAVDILEIFICQTEETHLLGYFGKVLFQENMAFAKSYNRDHLYKFTDLGEGLNVLDRIGSAPGSTFIFYYGL